MNVTIPMLLVSTVVTAFTPQTAAQESNQPRVSSRRPVDVSVEGLGEVTRRMPGDTTRVGSIGLSARRTTGGLDTPLDCLERLADQATGGCLQASSTPILGVLYPYPGYNNTFVPHAVVAGGESNQATGLRSTIGGGYLNVATGKHATIGGGGGYYQYAFRGNLASGDYATIGGGGGNVTSNLWATVGGGFSNVADGHSSTVAGGLKNYASGRRATVGGGQSNLAEGNISTVGGGDGNSASESYATIGGGAFNTASSNRATVGGGTNNDSSGFAATVAGGSSNTASGTQATIAGGTTNKALGSKAAVGGGDGNNASGDFATIAGGGSNVASGYGATVGGGGGRNVFVRNRASGAWAMVPGGLLNTAQGNYSFAAGRRARANNDGAFVWGDSQNADKTSSVADEFNVYASGGVRLFTNSTATTGVLLAAGGSSWTMVSDRDAKENVEAVDVKGVLEKVVELPLATWNYKAQDDSIRHMGPMAQDFYAAFGLGLGEKTIDTIDPNGVALAAIQGLNAELEELRAEKDAEIEKNRAEIEGLRAANQALLTRVERLEALAQTATWPR